MRYDYEILLHRKFCEAVFSLLVHKYLQLLSLNSYIPSPTPTFIVFIFNLSQSQSQSQGGGMFCLPEAVIWSGIFFSALKMGNITYNHISRICSKSQSLESIHSLPLHLSLVLVSMDSVAL